jgi:hypothetical protein
MLCGWLPPEKLLICCVDDYHLKKLLFGAIVCVKYRDN